VWRFETDFSTQSQAPSQNPWIPRAYDDPRRPQRVKASASKGPSSPYSIRKSLASQGFPKSFRLLRRRDFRRVYDDGQRRSVPLCTVFIRPNGLPHSRLGVTTPVRLGNAVLRNRMKRRLREVFRRHRAHLPGGWDFLVNPREQVAAASFQTLEAEFLRLFPRQPPPRVGGESTVK
jgi:ribonuclease P protein component